MYAWVRAHLVFYSFVCLSESSTGQRLPLDCCCSGDEEDDESAGRRGGVQEHGSRLGAAFWPTKPEFSCQLCLCYCFHDLGLFLEPHCLIFLIGKLDWSLPFLLLKKLMRINEIESGAHFVLQRVHLRDARRQS